MQPENEVSVTPTGVSSNSHVFKRLRKVSSDGASLTAGGRLFQSRAAATGNAREVKMEGSGVAVI